MSAEIAEPAERRRNPALRALFDEAYARIEPCLDPRHGWNGQPLEHFAFRMLREAYPELTPQDARILVGAALRVWRERNPAAPAAQPAVGRIPT